jgi:GT2 family glycosyltransferase
MDVTTVIINYQTPDLLEVAVNTFKKHYPEVPLLIVDNGSKDESKKAIQDLTSQNPKTESLFLDKNIYHGPAMDLVIRNHVQTGYTFFLDSDTETHRSGFLEKMTSLASAQDIYAVGETITINNRGFKDDKGFNVLMTPFMLIKTKVYKQFPPFIHHGQPTIHNFRDAQKEGLELAEFQVSDYIFHHWRGTANRFGYGLGLKSKLDYLLNKIGL